MLGWTREEYRLWLASPGLLERVDRLGAVALAGAMARCRCGPEVPRGYRGPSRRRHRRDRRPAGHRPPPPLPAAPPGRRPPRHLVRLRVRLALQPPRPRRLPRPGARLRLRHRRRARGREARRARAPPGSRRRHARGVGAVRRGRGPGVAGVGRHASGTHLREGEPAVVHGPRDRELALWEAEFTASEAAVDPADPADSADSADRKTQRPGALPLSVVRRLRRPGGVRRG
jgi:para-nitrobenzyl esterase